MEFWSDGVMEYWSAGVSEYRSIGVLGTGIQPSSNSSIPTLQHSNTYSNTPILQYSDTPILHHSIALLFFLGFSGGFVRLTPMLVSERNSGGRFFSGDLFF